MAHISLGHGRVALVDDDDLEWLSRWRWHASRGKGSTLYATSTSGGGRRKMHRVITSASPGREVDHCNGNGLDNRRCNLRLCTRSQNGANRGLQSNNSSGYVGVSWHRAAGKWMSYIKVHGQRVYLGLFEDVAAAARAHDSAAVLHFGEFARVSFEDPAPAPIHVELGEV